jgi:hypothetical protein
MFPFDNSFIALSMLGLVFISVDISKMRVLAEFGYGGCDIGCKLHGICVANGNKTDCTITANESCKLYKCVCNYGYIGNDCSLKYETCAEPITSSPDKVKQCFNGGKCETYRIENTDNDNEEAQYGTRCNCQSLPNDTIAYAGHQCEYPAEEICVLNANFSTYAFCVNGGTCKDNIDFNEEHPLCNCPLGSGGRHCQFNLTRPDGFKFNVPEDEIEYINKILHGNETVDLESYTKDDELSGGMKFFIILLVFVLCMIPLCYCYRIKKQRQLTTNADGNTSMSSVNATKETDGTTRTDDEVQDDKREII